MEQTLEGTAAVDKKTAQQWFSPGNILTIISMAAGGMWVLASMNSAIAVQNEKITSQRDETKASIARIERQSSQDRAEILENIREMRQELREAVARRSR